MQNSGPKFVIAAALSSVCMVHPAKAQLFEAQHSSAAAMQAHTGGAGDVRPARQSCRRVRMGTGASMPVIYPMANPMPLTGAAGPRFRPGRRQVGRQSGTAERLGYRRR